MSNPLLISNCLDELYVKQFFRKTVIVSLVLLFSCVSKLADKPQIFPFPPGSNSDSSSWHFRAACLSHSSLRQLICSSNAPQNRPGALARFVSEVRGVGCHLSCCLLSFLWFQTSSFTYSANSSCTSEDISWSVFFRMSLVSPVNTILTFQRTLIAFISWSKIFVLCMQLHIS